MFRNKLVKALAAAAFAVVGVGVAGTVNSNNTNVQASAFHYFRKDHKMVTFGLGDSLPVRNYDHGKLVQKDDPEDENSYCSRYVPLRSRGWKYINGVKYYNVPSQKYLDTTGAYMAAKYFTKDYNVKPYFTIYRANKKISALADDMQNTDDGMWYGKGDTFLVVNYSILNHSKYVDTISNIQDGKHNADGWYSPDGGGIGGELKPSQFKKRCTKAGKNVKFIINKGTDWCTNGSLARGGIYHNGHFYKLYSRDHFGIQA